MKVEAKKIKYSLIKEPIFGKRFQKIDSQSAQISHFLQKSIKVDFNSSIFKGMLNGHAQEILSKPVFKDKKVDIEWDVPFPPPAKPDFTFIDLFAGIGGFRIALQNQGGKCVFSSEINNAAKQTYETNFGEFPFGDIRELPELRLRMSNLIN